MSMHQGVAKDMPFFKGRDRMFVCTVIPFLKHWLCLKGDFVYREGEYAEEIYFIVKGRCSIIDESNKAFQILNDKCYFGDIEVIK